MATRGKFPMLQRPPSSGGLCPPIDREDAPVFPTYAEEAARFLAVTSKLRKSIAGLLEILGSDWIKQCESMAFIHGARLEEETSKRYGAIQDEARKLLGE